MKSRKSGEPPSLKCIITFSFELTAARRRGTGQRWVIAGGGGAENVSRPVCIPLPSQHTECTGRAEHPHTAEGCAADGHKQRTEQAYAPLQVHHG